MRPRATRRTSSSGSTNRFGWRLYSHFFKGYTEKVWGVSTTELRAEWAAQRIKGLSFWSAAKAAFFGNKGEIKSLIDKFQYPRYGPGQMWEMMTERIEEIGGEVRLETP
jgi:protoporphyrinogen oxidase